MSGSDHEERLSQLRTRSQVSASHKSSRVSNRTSVSAAATRARAKAEAAKIKVSFAEKEAVMMKEKASIEASLHVLKQEKEATAASKEAAVFEEAAAELEQREIEFLGELEDLAVDDPMKRTRVYVETQLFDTHAPQELQGASPPPPVVYRETANAQLSSEKTPESLYESFMEKK